MDNAAPALADRVRNIILRPRAEWPVIDAEPATIGGLYTRYVLILAAIPAVAALLGNMVFGISAFGLTVRMSPVTAISFAISQYAMSLISVFVLGLIIDALAPSFGGTRNQVQATKVAAYSCTAAWVAGVLAIVPQLAPLGGLLGLYGLYLLYVGLPLLMRAPADKAIGYAVVTIITTIVLFVVVGAIANMAGRMFAPAMPLADTMVSGTMTAPGGRSVDLAILGAAARQAELDAGEMKIGDSGEAAAISPSELQALLPATLGGYRRTEIESSEASAGGIGGTHAAARYEKGDTYVRLGLTDMAGAGAVAMSGGVMNAQVNRETANGYEKTRTVGGRMVSEKWDRPSREGSYSELVASRFMVSAEGKVSDIAELRRAAAMIPVDRLVALTN